MPNMEVTVGGSSYGTVAASTTKILGGTGAKGDYLSGVTIIPATTSPGAVSITDGTTSTTTIFAGGSSSVSALVPFFVVIGAASLNGAWSVVTGANVSAFASGRFTG